MITTVKVTDRPVRLNLHNYEQRLKKMRHAIALLLAQIDEALAMIEAERKKHDTS